MWEVFRKYHYLNSELNKAAKCYVGLINGELVSFCAVFHFPHPIKKNIKRVHRLVVKPDYQGIGLGTAFLTAIAKTYRLFDFNILSSSKTIMHALKKRDDWVMFAKGQTTKQSGSETAWNKTSSQERITYSFRYIPKN